MLSAWHQYREMYIRQRIVPMFNLSIPTWKDHDCVSLGIGDRIVHDVLKEPFPVNAKTFCILTVFLLCRRLAFVPGRSAGSTTAQCTAIPEELRRSLDKRLFVKLLLILISESVKGMVVIITP